MSYAEGTVVSESKSRMELERLLSGVGAQRFGTLTDNEARRAIIAFDWQNLHLEMSIPLPGPNDKAFGKSARPGWVRSPEAKRKLCEQEVRCRWRCLVLALKAKLISVSIGITTFEREFLPYVVTADGTTIGDKLLPLLENAKRGSVVPSTLALPAPAGGAQ